MAKRNFPFNPFLDRMYSPDDLFREFDPRDPQSFQQTLDFRVYRYFVKAGEYAPKDYFDSMMQSLHDNSVTQAMRELLGTKERVIAVMGGHKLPRNSKPYTAIVEIARRLAQEGVLVTSGGGPGAMEASHLGAFLASSSDSAVADALERLETAPVMPAAKGVVAEDGTVDEEVAEAIHAWYKPAFEIVRGSKNSAESLAVPTWHYGHEPPTPFASHIAKYFQNSIREDGLLAVAKHGVIFAEGKAGTIQEIFQDATQNYYTSFGWFSPMVLLGTEYWTKTFPVVGILQALFGTENYKKYVRVTDSTDEAVTYLLAFTPQAR